MEEKEFQESKNGRLVWETNGLYFRFEPNALPMIFQPNLELSNQLLKTALAIGRLDGLTKRFSQQEVHLLRMPFILKEATLSSEIEGTRSTLTDVYKGEKQKETDQQKVLDNEEIRNYAKALEYGLKNNKPIITEDFVRELHKILLTGVRGQDKEPGQYKIYQNAIGQRQDTFETAKFVPASPQTTPSLMRNLVDYIETGSDVNTLYKIGIIHYQFEAIHPFRDGNGRLGRLLIVIMLCKEHVLSQPLLYISEYFNRNRSTYTDSLYDVSSKNKINEWVMFFLKALEIQANNALDLLQRLEEYKQELHTTTEKISQSPKIHSLVEALFKNPFITIKDVSVKMEMTLPGASNLVHKLEKTEILKEITGKKSRKVFVAHKILDILGEKSF